MGRCRSTTDEVLSRHALGAGMRVSKQARLQHDSSRLGRVGQLHRPGQDPAWAKQAFAGRRAGLETGVVRTARYVRLVRRGGRSRTRLAGRGEVGSSSHFQAQDIVNTQRAVELHRCRPRSAQLPVALLLVLFPWAAFVLSSHALLTRISSPHLAHHHLDGACSPRPLSSLVPRHGRQTQHGSLWRRAHGGHLLRHDGRRPRHRHARRHHRPRAQPAQQAHHGQAGPLLRCPPRQGGQEDTHGQARRPDAQVVRCAPPPARLPAC